MRIEVGQTWMYASGELWLVVDIDSNPLDRSGMSALVDIVNLETGMLHKRYPTMYFTNRDSSWRRIVW